MIDLVISHYNEDLKWIKDIKKDRIHKIFIYSKYNNQQEHAGIRQRNINKKFDSVEYYNHLSDKIRKIKSPNIGRESETYLRYCFEQYNSKVDGVVFLQGQPHVDIRIVNSWIDQIADHEPYTDNYKHLDLYNMLTDGKLKDWYGKCNESKYNCFTWMRTYVDSELYPYKIKTYLNAEFGIAKKFVKTRSRIYYLDLIHKELMDSNPESAHFFERLWFYIFNCHKL